MNKPKIVFILPSLKAGGAERVLSFLSCNLNTSKFQAILLVLGFKNDAVYKYPAQNTHFLNKARTRQALPEVFKFLRTEKPQLVMGSIGQVNAMLGIFSLVLPKTKFVGRIASVNSVMSQFSNQKGNRLAGALSNFGHKKLDKIICQSKDMEEDLVANYGISKSAITVINNPITSLPNTLRKRETNPESVKFITVGRLSKEKGHERILKSLSKIDNYPFHYTIVGSGPMETDIKMLVKELSLESRVTFIPYSSKVNELLIAHHVFLQGSFVEGFPNAALESCVAGVPVLAFDVKGGTKEIIKNDVNGVLVNSEEAFEIKLRDVMALISMDPQEISTYTLSKFSSSIILKKYETVFEELIP